MRYWRIPTGLLVLALLVLTGCGGSGSGRTDPTAGGTPTGKEGLESLAELLKGAQAENRQPPAKLGDVERVEPLYPGAYIALVQGTIVYSWGTPLSPSGGDKVLAHEKSVPT